MQHIDEIHCAVESLLHAHCAAIDEVRMLCRTRGRHWIHGQSCDLALASTYKQALQKITNMLTALLLSDRLSAQHLQIFLQPALDNVLAAILQGKSFIKSCRFSVALYEDAAVIPHHLRKASSSPSDRSFSQASSVSSYGGSGAREDESIEDVDKSWLLKVMLKGLATDAMEAHLHDFLVSFSAFGAATQELSKRMAHPAARIMSDPAPTPETFWKSDQQNKPHVLLVSAKQLDYAKQNDETVLCSQLEQFISLKGSSPLEVAGDAAPVQGYTTTRSGSVNDAAQFDAAFVREKIRCTKQGFQDSLGPGFLDINELEVVDTIADSFWASVHRVMWLGKRFALKMYRKAMEEAFLQEARVHVRLNHPNVVQAIALFKGEQKEYGILTELLDETLHSFLQKHPSSLSLQVKVRIMLSIANGMAYVHEKGVIHRDLKPSNVLVRSSMDTHAEKPTRAVGTHQIEVKVADFGESRSRMPNSSSFRTKKVGTTVYRAPEVLNEDSQSSYEKSADVYSFAMTCFELLAEIEPFHEADRTKELWERVQAGERPNLESVSDAACPPYLKHCLTAWWAQEPRNRHSFAHIGCVLRHLYACLARCPSNIEPIQQFSFLGWPLWRWKNAQALAQERLDHFETRRDDDDWNSRGYRCGCTRVNEIPYEMLVMDWAIKNASDEPEKHQQSEIHRVQPTRASQIIGGQNNEVESCIANTQAPASMASSQAENPSRKSNSRIREKLREFCCFYGDITPGTHMAFRKSQ